ncbi:CRISPR-associated helicase Cas3' [Spirulina subsalsa FACHB-351]|uniref:CRISPR-associated helicase Cas3 n=1 Tax=Spirulina subsalsa FACHB-351 TaxID=234711 RepID=A0ABT3LB04_9CYAN|nr:CRISPR-associated helicase Cas3' [Spirulina subsalsa]MCW6038672.1 CRISPR-associated helicase Cas3' [Spirulina subsalsa FACHB-351]
METRLEPNLLLAKSFKAGQWKGSYSLVGHTADVVNAVSTLVDILGDRLLQQFDLNYSFNFLKSTVRKAAYLHDWGKANHHFQQVVRQQRNPLHEPQMIRHEVASVLLAWEFREWLEQGDGDFLTALVAGGGHHLKLGGKKGKVTDEFGEIRQSGEDRLLLYAVTRIHGKFQYHPYFRPLLKYGIKALGLPPKITLSQKPSESWSVSTIKQKRGDIQLFFEEQWQPNPVFLAVIKALVIAGDAVGSAIPNTNLSIHKWITEEVERTLDEAKLDQVIAGRLEGKTLRPFQIQLAETSTRVTLAQAGCGTGKTLGAYNWARAKALGRKLIFCYPTTGTSTEGFLDYVHDQVDSILLHSRADVDLAMATTGEEEEAGETVNNEVALKLESFQAWGREAIICTVDTVLGLLQCNRRPIYCFPAIAQAAFVFDEVHCYDERLFGALLRFLEVVKAPILLMSASFLPWQRTALQDAVGEPLDIISGPPELETQPRYRFHYSEQMDWSRVTQELEKGGKVLWVCNQVNTAISVYQEARERGLNALLYHSRFRYEDRVQHHRAVVGAFKPEHQEPVLAITTQVAEMSLDLSATLLVSQVANPAGLIQRLGRLNRRYCGRPLDALFYPDEKVGYPYSSEELNQGLQLIQSFPGDVCQRDLAQWLENIAVQGQPETDSVLLDKTWQTYSTSLRKASFNATVLLEQDLPMLKILGRKQIPRYTVPIPIKSKEMKAWKKYKLYPLAPTQKWDYSSEFGATKN